MNLTTVSKRAHVISKILRQITKVHCASQRNLIKETEIIKPLKPGVKNHITTKFIYLFAKLDTYKINAFPKHRNQLPMFNVPPITQNGCYVLVRTTKYSVRLPTNHIFQGARVCFSYLLCSYAPLSITVFTFKCLQFLFLVFYNERLIHHLWLLFMLCVRSFVFSFPLMTLNHLL